MNDQLRTTLDLLQGGVTQLDPGVAVPHLRSWASALPDQAITEELRALLGRAAELLQSGEYAKALILMPLMATQIGMISGEVPQADQDGLRQLAELLQKADNGPTE